MNPIRLTRIVPWFLQNIKEIVGMEDELVKAGSLEAITEPPLLMLCKQTF